MNEPGEKEYFAEAVEELLSARIRRFATWLEKEWRIAEKDATELNLTPEQIVGWNRCCDSLEGAAALWLDELSQ